MKRSSAVVWISCLALLCLPLSAQAKTRPGGPEGHWVNTWVTMPQLTEPSNMPPAPFTGEAAVFVDTTLRQTLHVSVGGHQLRVRLSNAFGDTAITIDAARLALPDGGLAGVSAIQPGTDQPLTFNGKPSVTIPAGAQVVSDVVRRDLAPLSNLTVTIYSARGQPSLKLSSHPGSRTTSYLVPGNHVADVDLPGAASTNHWYLLGGVEVWASPFTAGVVMLGDSLTDGRGSTTNGNDRWPDQLSASLQASPLTSGVAVLNQAAGGNRVLNDGLGPNALARLDRDLLAQSGVRWMIVFEGVNDLGTAAATAEAQQQAAADLIDAYEQIIRRAHAQNILVYGATLTPFQGNGYYDETGLREAARQTVNRWIRGSGRFDAVIDFDLAVRDPANPAALSAAADVGDHLHLSPAGYRLLADAVHPGLFWHRWRPNERWHFDDDAGWP